MWDASELESRTRFKRKKIEEGSDSQEVKYARYFSGEFKIILPPNNDLILDKRD